MPRRRNPRIDKQVRAALADLIESQAADPRLRFVTITETDVTPDHEVATVYYSTLDPNVVSEDSRGRRGDRIPTPDEVAQGLEAAAGHLRGRLARRVGLRATPELRFRPDPVTQHAARVEELISQLEPREVPPGTGGVEESDDPGV